MNNYELAEAETRAKYQQSEDANIAESRRVELIDGMQRWPTVGRLLLDEAFSHRGKTTAFGVIEGGCVTWTEFI